MTSAFATITIVVFLKISFIIVSKNVVVDIIDVVLAHHERASRGILDTFVARHTQQGAQPLLMIGQIALLRVAGRDDAQSVAAWRHAGIENVAHLLLVVEPLGYFFV